MGLFSKIKDGLKKTKDIMVKQVENVINSFTKIDEELFEELEEILILSDVGHSTSSYICELLRKRIKQRGITDAHLVKGLLKEIIFEILSTNSDDVVDYKEDDEFNIFSSSQSEIDTSKKIILVIGVNGVGKTTTIGKLANIYKMQGKTVLLSAADTFRAAAIDQLEIWAERAGCPIVKHKEGSDPAAVVYDSIISAKSRKSDIVICDTAGRLHNKKNLMEELSKMTRIIKREYGGSKIEILLVLDATTGQNALIQAKEFKDSCGITGIVLTKLDGTAKGGIVIAIKHDLGIPVQYIGVGEQIDDLQEFDPEMFVNALFDN